MLGRHIRSAGITLVKAALTKHALALTSAPKSPAPVTGALQEPQSTSATAAAAVPKVVSTPPGT